MSLAMLDPRSEFDRHMMDIALRMARRGLGQTAPNPSVGAVVADEATGEVIARGWTQPGGRPHAEAEALRRAGDAARGRTMYVTLEPCAHTGHVPTCADSMVATGLKRVVAAIPDPNPVVSGRGFAQLRAVNIEVDVGLGADEARWITIGHILRQTLKRPFVRLKMALDARYRVAIGRGAPVWVTGEEARAEGHLLRARADAILVGAGTVDADNPELTCRLPGLLGRSPDRIIVDSKLRTAASAKVYREMEAGRRVWLATAVSAEHVDARGHTERGVRVVPNLADTGGGVDLVRLLGTLADRGVTRLLVEGGPSMWRSFLAAQLVDEAVVFIAPHVAERAGFDIIDGDLDTFFSAFGLLPHASRQCGTDRMHVFRRDA